MTGISVKRFAVLLYKSKDTQAHTPVWLGVCIPFEYLAYLNSKQNVKTSYLSSQEAQRLMSEASDAIKKKKKNNYSEEHRYIVLSWCNQK